MKMLEMVSDFKYKFIDNGTINLNIFGMKLRFSNEANLVFFYFNKVDKMTVSANMYYGNGELRTLPFSSRTFNVNKFKTADEFLEEISQKLKPFLQEKENSN